MTDVPSGGGWRSQAEVDKLILDALARIEAKLDAQVEETMSQHLAARLERTERKLDALLITHGVRQPVHYPERRTAEQILGDMRASRAVPPDHRPVSQGVTGDTDEEDGA